MWGQKKGAGESESKILFTQSLFSVKFTLLFLFSLRRLYYRIK